MYPFFAFAQCTIGQDWGDKKHEAIAENGLGALIDLDVRHSNYLMIPHFPRYNLEEWSEDSSRTANCILCDRFRIYNLLEKSAFFENGNLPKDIANVFKLLESNLNG